MPTINVMINIKARAVSIATEPESDLKGFSDVPNRGKRLPRAQSPRAPRPN